MQRKQEESERGIKEMKKRGRRRGESYRKERKGHKDTCNEKKREETKRRNRKGKRDKEARTEEQI